MPAQGGVARGRPSAVSTSSPTPGRARAARGRARGAVGGHSGRAGPGRGPRSDAQAYELAARGSSRCARSTGRRAWSMTGCTSRSRSARPAGTSARVDLPVAAARRVLGPDAVLGATARDAGAGAGRGRGRRDLPGRRAGLRDLHEGRSAAADRAGRGGGGRRRGARHAGHRDRRRHRARGCRSCSRPARTGWPWSGRSARRRIRPAPLPSCSRPSREWPAIGCVGEACRRAAGAARRPGPSAALPAVPTVAADVAVVGGGPIGLAIAWRCAQRGLAVDRATTRGRDRRFLRRRRHARSGRRVLLRRAGAHRAAAGLGGPLAGLRGRSDDGDRGGPRLPHRGHAGRGAHRGRPGRGGAAGVVPGRSRACRSARCAVRSCATGSRCCRPGCAAAAYAPGDHQVDPRRLVEALRAACRATGVRLVEAEVVALSRAAAGRGGRGGGGLRIQGADRPAGPPGEGADPAAAGAGREPRRLLAT